MVDWAGCFSSKCSLTPRTISLAWDNAAVADPVTVNTRAGSRPNRVSTVRFPSPVAITWLPKSLFAQFMRAANRYFLFVSFLVFFPFSPTAWSSTALPFAGVLFWSALKDLYEDMRRRRDDAAENLRPCWRFDRPSKAFVKVRWEEVLVGDVLLASQDEAFPADLLILAAERGRAFISTANLDGETNLKERRPPAPCDWDLEDRNVVGTAGGNAVVSCTDLGASGGSGGGGGGGDTEPPARRSIAEEVAKLVYDKKLCAHLDPPKVGFDDMGGRVFLGGSSSSSPSNDSEEAAGNRLSSENFAPRGCVLRNTAWLVAVAAYVGDESKSRLKVAVVDAKFSNLQVYLNRCILGLVAVLAIFCLYAASMAQLVGEASDFEDFVVSYFQYWIILYQIVPISLYVCFEIVKLLLGLQINLDPQMMDPDTQQFALARTADLVEEMGQVQHIFSDKTGTITRNEMRFARCCIESQDLGEFREELDDECNDVDIKKGLTEAGAPDGVVFTRRVLSDKLHQLFEQTHRFFLCLAVCHSAQVELEKGNPVFTGSSPDEVAFLEAASSVGMVFREQRLTTWDGSSATQLTIETPHGPKQVMLVAQVPFSSDRKRMSVICEVDGELMCITKGADSVMGPLCDGSLTETSLQQIETYAKMGLRTLVVAWKPISQEFLASWKPKMEVAKSSSIEDRAEKMAACALQLEHSLSLTGISGIEDRLQEGVPAAMSTLKAMGIRIWVLTGDKVETAVEIAKACHLLTESMTVVTVVNATSVVNAKEMLREAKAQAQGLSQVAFVFDGGSMKFVADDEEGQELLFHIGIASKVCICCRLAPQQKRRLVELVRSKDEARITLAVGDGANDVPMIQGAHVGVGVRGKEGNQSVQASDVAISQFRFLVPLLLCHGRRAYRRVATFLCYYIYKHVVLAVGDMCWAHQSEFGGQIAYPEWVASCYAAFFTSLPVIVVLVFDRDIPDRLVYAHPELYHAGQQRIHFNTRIFATWILSGVWHGCIVWLIPNLAVGASGPGDDPDWNQDWWVASIVSFTLVVVFVDLRLWLIALNKLSIWTLLGLLSSPALYIVALVVLGHTYLGEVMQPQIQGVPWDALQNSEAISALFLTPLVMLLDVVFYCLLLYLRPSPLDEVRRSLKSSRVSPPLSDRLDGPPSPPA